MNTMSESISHEEVFNVVYSYFKNHNLDGLEQVTDENVDSISDNDMDCILDAALNSIQCDIDVVNDMAYARTGTATKTAMAIRAAMQRAWDRIEQYRNENEE